MAKAPQFAVPEVHGKWLTQTTAPLAGETQGTTGETTLDDEAVRSLQSMFLLLDEWDRAMQCDCPENPNSPEEWENAVDINTA